MTAKPTVDTIEADILHQKVRQQTLHPTDLRTFKGLTDLATQHFENFGKLRSGICGPMVPKRTLRIGTACTGSSADLISMIAIQKAALAALCADFTFKYVFNCEKTPYKRQWIAQLHQLCQEPAAHGPDGAAPGLVGEAPCLFEDIQELKNGKCRCHAHEQRKGNKEMCEVGAIDLLFCSTSCKDLSRFNSTKQANTVLAADTSPGGSAETFNGLCDLMYACRPDILIWENVDEVAKPTGDGTTSLDVVLERWQALGYECQVCYCNTTLYGLPQNRYRVYITALNVRDPRTITFEHRSHREVFVTFGQLLKVCHRQPECASAFLLDADNAHVKEELKRLQIEAAGRKDVGFNLEKPMQICESTGIPWGSFPPQASLEESRWFQTLTMQQQMSLAFSMAAQPEHYIFRDFKPSFGRTRLCPADLEVANGEKIHIAGTIVPTQLIMVFDDKNPDSEPRLLLGRESFWLQGFPIDIIDNMKMPVKESTLIDLAGNMVSTPVFLAMIQSTLAAVTWRVATPCQEAEAEPATDDLDESMLGDLLKAVEPPTDGGDVNDGLMHGPAGLADVGVKRRRGGLLARVYSKVGDSA